MTNRYCEHCKTLVPVAKVCGACGRDHSEEWIKAGEAASEVEAVSILTTTVSVFAAIVYVVVIGIPTSIGSDFIWIMLIHIFIGMPVVMVLAAIVYSIYRSCKKPTVKKGA